MEPFNLLLSLIELAIVVAFALVAVALKTIDRRGFLASVLIGCSIIYGGGMTWFAVIASFFVLGVGFTFYKYEHKKRLGAAEEKGGSRNWPNILANGGAAAIFAVMQLVSGGGPYAFLFVGAMSAAASDTVATELGLLSKSPPRLITRLSNVVTPGTSGGVTALGFLGAFLASGAIGVLSLLLGVGGGGLIILPAAVFGGVVGAVGDSVLGAVVQRKGLCNVCGRSTERLTHCGEKTKTTGGVGFVENNVVNFLATIVGGGAALLFALLY